MHLLRVIIALVLCTGLAQASGHKVEASREYQLKAAFLINFARFVEWPDESKGTLQTPLVIGILGEGPFGSALDDVSASREGGGRPVSVVRFKSVDEVKGCHLLFIDLPRQETSNCLKKLPPKGILTVGEEMNFVKSGGVISLFLENRKIRFAINTAAAERAELRISSKLLKLAREVGCWFGR